MPPPTPPTTSCSASAKARARQIGIEAYLEEQLNPDWLDDSAADERLRNLPILTMDRHSLHRLRNGEYRTHRALIEGMITRAVYSQRQLLERLVEFSADHFNVSGDAYAQDMIGYQREAIRANALGRFRDLLLATAGNGHKGHRGKREKPLISKLSVPSVAKKKDHADADC